jgi:hypothetical protein
VELLKVAFGGSDGESVVDSQAPSDAERDWVRGLAQRATEPDIKERKAKGPFVVRWADNEMHPFHTMFATTVNIGRCMQKVLPLSC